jgi:hemerythrin
LWDNKARFAVASLKWTSDCSVYVAEVDDEHRLLFRLADEIQTALLRGDGIAELRTMAQALVADLAAHFANEEERMHATRYRSITWHRMQHEAATRRALALLRQIESGDREAVSELLQYLAEFLKSHLSLTDRMMAAHLRNFARARNLAS